MEYGIDVSKIDRRSYQCPGCRDAGKVRDYLNHAVDALSRDFRPTHVQCFDSDEDRRLGRNHAADFPCACHPLPPFNQPPPFPALRLQRPPSLGPPQRCALPQCTSSPSFLPLSPPVQHSDCNDRRRLGRHNAADRLAIAQAAAAAAEAGGATGGEKDRRGSGGGADKPGGSGSPGRILFGGGTGGGGGGGGSVPSGRRKSRQSSGGGAAAAGGVSGRNSLLAAAAAAAVAAVAASPASPLSGRGQGTAGGSGGAGGGEGGAGGDGAGGGGRKGVGGGRGSGSVKVLFKGGAGRGGGAGEGEGEGEAVKSDEGGSAQHGSCNDTDSDTFPDSLHSPNPSSDSTPGDHADSANRVDRIDQSKPELAIDQRIHPVDHIDQIDPMDTTDDKGAGEVEGEEGERDRNRKSSSSGHHSNNSQDNSNEYDNSEYGWKKSPGAAAGAAAAAVAGSVLPRSSKRVQGSSAKPLKVDLSKLQTSSLRRYKRVYKLRDASSGKVGVWVKWVLG
ncbi:unnamed protein product [Closterium sp. NIES-53]